MHRTSMDTSSIYTLSMHTASSNDITLEGPFSWGPTELPTSREQSAVIAPWTARQPSPPPSRNNFNLAASMRVIGRQASHANVSRSRGSEITLAESFNSTSSNETAPSQRNKKSLFKSLKKSLSRPNLNRNAPELPPVPPPTVIFSDHAESAYSIRPSSSPTPSRKPRKSSKPKFAPDLHGEQTQPVNDLSLMLNKDLRDVTLDVVDVVAPSSLQESKYSITTTTTTSSPIFEDFGHETGWRSRYIGDNNSSSPVFTDPFPTSSRRNVHETTNLPEQPRSPHRSGTFDSAGIGEEPTPWSAPDSWALPKPTDAYTSSEDEDDPTPPLSSRTLSVPVLDNHFGTLPSRKGSHVLNGVPYMIRIHRVTGAYHVVSCPLDTTVAQLESKLYNKLAILTSNDPKRERIYPHRIYLRERGRERLLAPTDRPAVIVRRRLEHAGYDPADGLEILGADDIQFLLKFVFKEEVIGANVKKEDGTYEPEFTLDSFEYVDLAGKSLRAVPIVLFREAPRIVSLNLSKNPLLELPLDFIQLCEMLRELRLCHMAMKKVPQSIRHIGHLQRLDLSCNRLIDLDEAGLESIPGLISLKVQNNRLDRLPASFRNLQKLRFLIISNNKFEVFPKVACEMASLVDLDISFNTISHLPPELGKLTKLEKLIIVGNQVTKFPDTCLNLVKLSDLDCRRNNITDLSVICRLPRLETLRADHNAVRALDLSLGPRLKNLQVTNNDITQLTLVPSARSKPFSLTHLDISHAKLSSLNDFALAALTGLKSLKLDYNSFRTIPDVICSLEHLSILSCTDNELDALPANIGQLQKLTTLDAHNNNLQEVPQSIWNCGSLEHINLTSNLIKLWHDPPSGHEFSGTDSDPKDSERKTSVASIESMSSITTLNPFGSVESMASSTTLHPLPPLPPPLARSLKRLYLGDNRLEDDIFHPLNLLNELTVLNLSFNQIQEIPPFWLQSISQLEMLYLSGNKLTSLPAENLYRLTKLTVLFLNGNKLQTLPTELGKVKSLAVLDVGSNVLKYNVNNWEFDWNWNFNPQLRYLNLSGNKRLVIRRQDKAHSKGYMGADATESQVLVQKQLAEFTGLKDIRVLGLMDVTTDSALSLPDENEDRRVRTSAPEINGMAYGIADTLGQLEHVGMFDLVIPHFKGRHNECLFGMFGHSRSLFNNNKLTKFLHENFLDTFDKALTKLKNDGSEGVPDAMRRTFLSLNKSLFDHLTMRDERKTSTGSTASEHTSLRAGAEAVVVYMVGKTMWVANAGNALAVISRQGDAELISMNHEPFDRVETARIRAAEGWVSPKGLVNDEVGVSRSFGYYHVLPAVNPRPHVIECNLSDRDEFVIVGNRGLWDYVSYQTAVDIARNHRDDPMIAAQKLRDFAMSYGADGSTMIMVVCVADLFRDSSRYFRSRLPTDAETNSYAAPKRKKEEVNDRVIARLDPEVEPPRGQVALVFTDIRNSTFLWDKNAGMATAMRLHNNLLRRLLRFTGGYEVKTEGDAFMVSFSHVMSALHWCFLVQVQLLNEPWPSEILECEDGKEIRDTEGRLIARGLSVRMGIHWGMPYCERDPVTRRMDYLGPVVNRAARITNSAAGGQIMCSGDVISVVNEYIQHPDKPVEPEIALMIEAIRMKGISFRVMGERRMKGLEVPEFLTLVYPDELLGRRDFEEAEEAGAKADVSSRGQPQTKQIPKPPSDEHLENPLPRSNLEGTTVETTKAIHDCSRSRVVVDEAQVEQVAQLCLRLEALSSQRVFRPLSKGKSVPTMDTTDPTIMYGDPDLLLPSLKNRTPQELAYLLDSFTVRIDNALSTLQLKRTNIISSC